MVNPRGLRPVALVKGMQMTRQEMLLKAEELLVTSERYHGENGMAYAIKAQAWIMLANATTSEIHGQRFEDVLQCVSESVSV